MATPRPSPAATATPPVPTPVVPTPEPAPTETPANRLRLDDASVQYWSDPNSIHDLISLGDTLWAASYGGLVAWQRGTFTIYGMQEGLASQAVQALAVDNLGRLWVSYADVDGYSVQTDDGWLHYATRRDAIAGEYAHLLNSRRTHPRMWTNRPESGWLWQPRLDGRVEAYDGTRWRVYGTENGLTLGNRFVAVAQGGRVWAVGDGIAYAEEGELWWQDHTFFSEIESPEDVTDISVDSAGTLWMTFAGAELGGLIRFDPAAQRWEGHTHEMNPAIPTRAFGMEILSDGTLWVMGEGRLSYHAPQRQFRGVDLEITVLSTATDSQGQTWIGTQEGLWQVDLERGITAGPFVVPSPLPDNRITALALDAEGTVFVATPRGVSWIEEDGHTELATDEAVAWLGAGPEGDLWAATPQGLRSISKQGLGPVTMETVGLVSATIAADGRMYVLTDQGRLAVSEGGALVERLDVLTTLGVPPRALAVDPSNGVWIASAVGLLHLLEDGSQERYTRDNGLLSDDVRGVTVDVEGNIWAATASGLARHRPDGRWTRFTVESTGGGLRDMDMRDVSIGPTGDLWMATRAGLSRREPEQSDWSYVDLPGATIVLHDGADTLWVSTGAGLYRVPVAVLTPVLQ
ncbi:MAG: ligand-binding sensor domain-containing protein [Anaerolineae bacterium]